MYDCHFLLRSIIVPLSVMLTLVIPLFFLRWVYRTFLGKEHPKTVGHPAVYGVVAMSGGLLGGWLWYQLIAAERMTFLVDIGIGLAITLGGIASVSLLEMILLRKNR